MAKSSTAHIDTLTIEKRDHAGTTSANAVRRAGKIPGVLYGHGDPTPIAIGAKALEELLMGASKTHVLDATIDGKHDSVLLRSVQRDPVSHRPIHADFQRVTKGEAVTASLAIIAVGTSQAIKDGAVMDLVTRAIDVKGPADKMPDNLQLDVSALAVHTHVSAGDLKLPAGFTLITPADTVIVSIEASRTAAQAEASAPAPVIEEAAPAAPAT